LRGLAVLMRPVLKNALTPRPLPQRGRCTACGTCLRACPQACISIEEGLAVVDDRRCIRCYCCHELCPERAIELRHSRLGRWLQRRRLLTPTR
jgi:ferredoxin